MFCSIHHKNRSMHLLEPIIGTDQYRCVAGNECQIGTGTGAPPFLTKPQQPQYPSMGSRNFSSPPFENHHQSPSQESTDKFMCSEHNKLRISTFLDQIIQNDGTTAYKCKVGEECKTFTQGGPRRPTESNNHRYSPYSSQTKRSSQLPPFKPGVRPTNYQPHTYDPYASQQQPQQQQQQQSSHHWPTNHHDPYGQSYRPPYSTYPPHFYSTYNSNSNSNTNTNNNSSHQSIDSRSRQMCATHGKLRTIPNLVELSSGKWECTSNYPCRQSLNETKDQGQQ